MKGGANEQVPAAQRGVQTGGGEAGDRGRIHECPGGTEPGDQRQPVAELAAQILSGGERDADDGCEGNGSPGTGTAAGGEPALADGAGHFKKSDGVLRERKELRFAFMEGHEGEWPVSVLCAVLEVSRSGYYAWRERPESVRRVRQRELVAEMRVIHGEKHKGNYGSPRMLAELQARGQTVSENTVARLMREH